MLSSPSENPLGKYPRMIGISILGSTGSIGRSTADVMRRHPDRFRVIALTANTDVDALFAQVVEFSPAVAAMRDEEKAGELRTRIKDTGLSTKILAGEEGLIEAAQHQDAHTVVAAIVGAAGLMPTLAAVDEGKRILLANKEALVMTGPIFMARARASGSEIIPVDSEHNAIFQCLPPGTTGRPHEELGVSRILLTGSGGPFLNKSLSKLANVTPDEACAHPKWKMGRKISVDSATMMNKGLEVIEAHLLFNIPTELIQVVIHPQAIIHSMVQYTDGSTLAQLGNPDMRIPIANALAHPERIESGVDSLDIFEMARFDFMQPDFERFPCLRFAYEAARAGGTRPAVLNAANEVAVSAFLNGAIRFLDIATVIESCLASIETTPADTLQAVLEADAHARQFAIERITMART